MLLEVVILAPARPAVADVKKECSAAYDDVQALRKQGKLRAARGRGASCAQDACPAFIQSDCDRWLKELESSQPTVVFAATDPSGAATSAARVLLDGQPLDGALDGRAMPVDPGKHKLRVELDGAPAVEQDLTLIEGEKNRKISVAFAKPKGPVVPSPAAATPPAAAAPAAAAPPPGARARGSTATRTGGAPAWAWAVGGLGLAAGAAGGALLGVSFSGQSNITANCGKAQPGFESGPCASLGTTVNIERGLGGALAGAGVLGLGVAIVVIAKAPPRAARTTGRLALELSPTLAPDRVGASFGGSF